MESSGRLSGVHMHDLTSPNLPVTEGESDHEPFMEPKSYEGTGWLLAGAEGLSQSTLAKFRAASLELTFKQTQQGV